MLFLGCSTAAQQNRKPAPTDVVATVGTASITLEEVDEKALQEPASSFGSLRLAQAIYEARRAAADEIVGNRLLDEEAKRRGIGRTALFEQEISSQVTGVTDAEHQCLCTGPTPSACRARVSIRSGPRFGSCSHGADGGRT